MKKLLIGFAALFTFSLVAPTIARAEEAGPKAKAKKGKKADGEKKPDQSEPPKKSE